MFQSNMVTTRIIYWLPGINHHIRTKLQKTSTWPIIMSSIIQSTCISRIFPRDFLLESILHMIIIFYLHRSVLTFVMAQMKDRQLHTKWMRLKIIKIYKNNNNITIRCNSVWKCRKKNRKWTLWLMLFTRKNLESGTIVDLIRRHAMRSRFN